MSREERRENQRRERRDVAILTCKALVVEFRYGVVIQGVRVFMENWFVLYLLFM